MVKNKLWILWGLILLKFILQYSLIDPVYELHRDEFLYLDQGRHLAWGYTSVPPVTSWISYLILLLGNGVFWVKFFPALFGALTLLVVWKAVEELKGGWFALSLATVSILFSVLLRINTLYQPTSPDVLFWALLYLFILKYIRSENPRWLYLTALVFAAGFLNKYNIAFLIIGLLPAMLLTEHRRIFRNKHLYGAAGLALLLISPNLIWQFRNDFPVIHHLGELAATQLVNVNRIDFLKEQVLFFYSSAWIIAAAGLAFVMYPPFRKYRLIGVSFLFTLLIFFWFRAKSYYAVGLYPILLAFGAVYLEQVLKGKRANYLRPIVLLLPILLFLPMFKLAFPNRTPQEIRKEAQRYQKIGLLRWEDGKDHALPQDFADMLGWKELAGKVDRAYAEIPEPEHTLILCDNYGQAGAINRYSKHTYIGAVSMNADYINWIRLDKEIRHVIRIIEVDDIDRELEKTKPYFETVLLSGAITNTFAREKGTSIYLMKQARVDVNEIVRKEIEERKKHR